MPTATQAFLNVLHAAVQCDFIMLLPSSPLQPSILQIVPPLPTPCTFPLTPLNSCTEHLFYCTNYILLFLLECILSSV